MCLYIDKTKTRKFKSRKTLNDKVVVYKRLVVDSDGTLYTPHQGVKVKLGQWLYSNRTSNKITSNEESFELIKIGIHVYNTKKILMSYYNSQKLFKCWAYREDLVAVGDPNEMVFTKVFIEKQID